MRTKRSTILNLEESKIREVANPGIGRSDLLVPALQALPGLELASPKGSMYAFFTLPVAGDSLAIAERLVQEAGPGPGNAFAPEANNWLRRCIASEDTAPLHLGVAWLQRRLEKSSE